MRDPRPHRLPRAGTVNINDPSRNGNVWDDPSAASYIPIYLFYGRWTIGVVHEAAKVA